MVKSHGYGPCTYSAGRGDARQFARAVRQLVVAIIEFIEIEPKKRDKIEPISIKALELH